MPDDEIQEALKKIPWNSLSAVARGRVKGVVHSHSLFRRMPVQAVYCDPEMFQYLLEHPDLVVGFWEQMGVTQISLKELREDRYLMKETTGTAAQVEVLHRTSDLCLVYAKGQYRGPFLARGIDGETVLLLQTRRLRDEDGEPYVLCKLDAFIRIENLGADFLAKLFSTSLGKIADANFEQTVAFIGHVSDAAALDARTLKRIVGKVEGVRSEVCDDFADVVDRVALRTAGREGRLFPQYAVNVNDHDLRSRSRATSGSVLLQGAEAPIEAQPRWVVLEESKPQPFIPRSPDRSFEAVLEKHSDFTASACTGRHLPETEPEAPRSGYAVPVPAYADQADEETPGTKSRVIFGTPKIVRPE